MYVDDDGDDDVVCVFVFECYRYDWILWNIYILFVFCVVRVCVVLLCWEVCLVFFILVKCFVGVVMYVNVFFVFFFW